MNIKTSRFTVWQRCLDLIQHLCVLSAFILFLAYVQSVTATEYESGQVAHAVTKR